jgi:NhaA family Na+:H+ antiporter
VVIPDGIYYLFNAELDSTCDRDDLMAVMVIAIFYTEKIFDNELMFGLVEITVLSIAHRMGVRNNSFYYNVALSIVWISF